MVFLIKSFPFEFATFCMHNSLHLVSIHILIKSKDFFKLAMLLNAHNDIGCKKLKLS